MELRDLITTDPEVLGSQAVFKGTRIPVESLFDHLEAGASLDEILEDFPMITRGQAVAVLDVANRLLTSKNIEKLYEAAA